MLGYLIKIKLRRSVPGMQSIGYAEPVELLSILLQISDMLMRAIVNLYERREREAYESNVDVEWQIDSPLDIDLAHCKSCICTALALPEYAINSITVTRHSDTRRAVLTTLSWDGNAGHDIDGSGRPRYTTHHQTAAEWTEHLKKKLAFVVADLLDVVFALSRPSTVRDARMPQRDWDVHLRDLRARRIADFDGTTVVQAARAWLGCEPERITT